MAAPRPNLEGALAFFSLQRGFSPDALRRSYYKLCRKHHPDKPGGTDHMMKYVAACHDILQTELAGPAASAPSSAPAPATPCPAPTQEDIDLAGVWAKAFMEELGKKGKSSQAKQLRAAILNIGRSKTLSDTMGAAAYCVHTMAHHATLYSHLSWERIGFKGISYHGYDVSQSGLQCIDYGNYEYMHILEFIALRVPDMQPHLCSLYRVWPTVDLWAPEKSENSVERLGDIVECIMAAFRGHDWFQNVIQRDHRQMFADIVALCRLYHTLVAMLHTGFTKWNGIRVRLLASEFRDSDFGHQWVTKRDVGRGMLLHSLLLASVQ